MSLLEVNNLKMHFPVRGGVSMKQVALVKAVDGVSFAVKPGETLGLVGESGCGKSTLGKCLVRLYDPTDGQIKLQGSDITHMSQRKLRPLRKDIQMMFQDPAESLNSRLSVRQIIREPLDIQQIGTRTERNQMVQDLLEKVGLPSSASDKFPFEFSGGQRQRIGVARAIALKPKMLVLDEPVSALDVSVQSQVLNLLVDLQKELNLAYIFIAHDLAISAHGFPHLGKVGTRDP